MTTKKKSVNLGMLEVGQTHFRLRGKRIICNIRYNKLNNSIPERILYYDGKGNFRSVVAQVFVNWSLGIERDNPLEMPPKDILKQNISGNVSPQRADRRGKGSRPKDKPQVKLSEKPEVSKPMTSNGPNNRSLLDFAAKQMGGIENLKKDFAMARIAELGDLDLTILQVIQLAEKENWYDYFIECKFSDLVYKIGKPSRSALRKRIINCIGSGNKPSGVISKETGIRIGKTRSILKELVSSDRIVMVGTSPATTSYKLND